LQDLVVHHKQPSRMSDDNFAARGQAHAGCAFVEKLITEEGLQALDLSADRRLGNPQRSSRLGEAAHLDHRD